MKLPLLYPEPYLSFFTPRNKKPSHLSSGKTSSQFDLLEIKIKEKTKWEGKAEQSFVYYFLKNYTKFVSEKNSQEILRLILKKDILRYIKKDIFNPSVRYLKYL